MTKDFSAQGQEFIEYYFYIYLCVCSGQQGIKRKKTISRKKKAKTRKWKTRGNLISMIYMASIIGTMSPSITKLRNIYIYIYIYIYTIRLVHLHNTMKLCMMRNYNECINLP